MQKFIIFAGSKKNLHNIKTYLLPIPFGILLNNLFQDGKFQKSGRAK